MRYVCVLLNVVCVFALFCGPQRHSPLLAQHGALMTLDAVVESLRVEFDRETLILLFELLDEIAGTIRNRVDAMPDHVAVLRAHGAWGAA